MSPPARAGEVPSAHPPGPSWVSGCQWSLRSPCVPKTAPAIASRVEDPARGPRGPTRSHDRDYSGRAQLPACGGRTKVDVQIGSRGAAAMAFAGSPKVPMRVCHGEHGQASSPIGNARQEAKPSREELLLALEEETSREGLACWDHLRRLPSAPRARLRRAPAPGAPPSWAGSRPSTP